MSDRELFMHDVRVRDRFLTEGAITKADIDRRLAALPDLANQCEDVDLEQPALSKDAADAASSLDAASTMSDRGAFNGDSPVRAATAIPAIADAGAAPVTSAPAVVEPVPAIAHEPAPQEPHGPASVPPPTASVDADWGDS